MLIRNPWKAIQEKRILNRMAPLVKAAEEEAATATAQQTKSPNNGKPKPQSKPQLTHFLCLPLVTPASRPVLERSLQAFKTELSSLRQSSKTGDTPMKDTLSRVIDGRAIRPVGTLHLTLGVMSVKQEELVEQAKQLLSEIDINAMLAAIPSSVTSITPLSISLRGLSSMHKPSQTSVLYTDPSDPTSRLLPFCEQLRDLFMHRGLIVDDKRPLKLHVTIVNTIYAKGTKVGKPTEEGKKRSRRRPGPVQIDARPLLEHFKEFVWAENVLLDRVAICEMGAKKVVDEKTGQVVEEAYNEIAMKALPL